MRARRRTVHRTARIPAALAMLMLLPAPAYAAGLPDRPPNGRGDVRITVVSSPPDLVSGGDARVRVYAPGRGNLRRLRVAVDGRDVTDRFHLLRRERVLAGVIDGLPVGRSTITARVESRRGDRARDALTITNHPLSGPMFSGPHQEPFACTVADDLRATGVPRPDGGTPTRLAPSTQPDCAMDTLVSYAYWSRGADAWREYDPASAPPASDVAEATTMDGKTVPFIVRWERGTINRFVYSIAVLAPQVDSRSRPDLSAWNGKLIYHFEGGVGIGHYQGDPDRDAMLYRHGLARGYAVAYSTGTKTGVHYDLEVGGETAIMVKDRFVGAYGLPVYTVGVGGSGGAIQQYVYGQNHEGLIDAAIPQYSYPDMITQTIHVGDCELLERWADFEVVTEGDTFWRQWSNRALIEGLNAVDEGVGNPFAPVMPWMPDQGSSECINGWRGLSPLALNPHYGDAPGMPEDVRRTVEWTHYADAVNVYGVAPDGFARRTWDNVGVQYGLAALRAGEIDAPEFLDLNANAGGWKNEPDMVQEGCPFIQSLCPSSTEGKSFEELYPEVIDPWSMRNMRLSPGDGQTPAPRTEADPGAVETAYARGLVFHGEIGIPVIDWRHYLEPWLNMHNSHQSFASRQRMLNFDGDASNQAIWFTMGAAEDDQLFDQTPMAFRVIDQWMRNIAKHPGRGVAGNRPDLAADACFDVSGELIYSGEDAWDGILDNAPDGPCTQRFPIHETSRIVAGGPITGDVFKCALQPVERAVERGVYGDVELAPAQVDRLTEIFPDGVCDYTQPGALRPHPGWGR